MAVFGDRTCVSAQKCAIVSRQALLGEHNLLMLLVARERVARWLADWPWSACSQTPSSLLSGRGPRPSNQCLSSATFETISIRNGEPRKMLTSQRLRGSSD